MPASPVACREAYERWKDYEGDWLSIEGVLLFGGQSRGPGLSELDNFCQAPFSLEDREFATVEHAFQALKTSDPIWRERIRSAPTPKEAQRLGRAAPLSDEELKRWREGGATEAMRRCLRIKFAQPKLSECLLNTGDRILAEQVNDDETWDDKIWGIGKQGVGQNKLGKLLMELRSELCSDEWGQHEPATA